MNRNQWLLDPRTYTTSILALLKDEFGEEVLQWDPATIELELRAIGIANPPSMLMDKIHAGSALFTSNLYFVSLETFVATVLAMTNNPTDTSSMAIPDLDEIIWSITEARLLLGKIYEEESFGHDVARLVGKLLADEGIYAPPEILRFAEYPEAEIANLAAYGRILEGEAAAIDAQVQFEQMHEASADLERVAMEKLQELFDQLRQLPLSTRNDEFFKQLTVA